MNLQKSTLAQEAESGPAPPTTDRFPVTHQHIFSVIRTLMHEGRIDTSHRPLRILDIGCGDGKLIHSLQTLLERHCPDLEFEIFGFDVGEHGFREENQMAGAIDYLTVRHPGVDWLGRIKLISDSEPWGYPEGSIDLAVSNQVIEHVEDLDHFLRNLRSSLKVGGQSIHVFPLQQCMQEAHCHVPFSHRIADFNQRVGWIKFVSRLGIGRYRTDRKVLGHQGLDHHAVETAKFIECWTTYRSFGEIARHASQLSMATSYHFSKNLLSAKLRQVSGAGPAERYSRWTVLGLEWLSYLFARSITSATLTIEPLSYDIGKRIAAEKAFRKQEAGEGQKGARK